MSGTSATARLTVTHFRERTKITVSLPKPFPRREREKKVEIAMISHSRRVARSADKSIGKRVNVAYVRMLCDDRFLFLFQYHYEVEIRPVANENISLF